MACCSKQQVALWLLKFVRALMPYGAVRFVQRLRQNHLCFGSFVRPKNINTEVYWNNRLAEVNGFYRDEPYYALGEYLPQDEPFTLLDIGCAIGDGAEWLAARFPRAALFGVDISSVGIAKAKARESSVTYSVMDISRQQLQGHWDYVCIVETLEHISDPYSVVDQAVACAAAAVFISVPLEPEGSTGASTDGGEHVWRFDQSAFDRYEARILLRDVLNGGTMPRVLFGIPGRYRSGVPGTPDA